MKFETQESPAAARVGWRFIVFYTSAQMGTSLVFLAPLLVPQQRNESRWTL